MTDGWELEGNVPEAPSGWMSSGCEWNSSYSTGWGVDVFLMSEYVNKMILKQRWSIGNRSSVDEGSVGGEDDTSVVDPEQGNGEFELLDQ